MLKHLGMQRLEQFGPQRLSDGYLNLIFENLFLFYCLSIHLYVLNLLVSAPRAGFRDHFWSFRAGETADLTQRKYRYLHILEPNPPFTLLVWPFISDVAHQFAALDTQQTSRLMEAPFVVLHSCRAIHLPLCGNSSRFLLYIWLSGVFICFM